MIFIHHDDFFGSWQSQDVVARDDILRTEHLPAVVAVLHLVEQAYLLQVLAVLEGTVLNHHLQVAVGVVRAAVGLPELHGLQLVAVCKGSAADGDGLVVVVRARVVVDAHHAVVLLHVVGIGTRHSGVPQVGIVRRAALVAEQRGGIELLVVGIPQAQRLHDLLVLVVGIAQGCAVLSLQETIDGAVHRDVVGGMLEGGDAVAHLHPRLTA